MTGADLEYAWFFRAEFPHGPTDRVPHPGRWGKAEDVTQEAFIQLLSHWKKVSRYERPDAWVRRVAIRLAVKMQKRERMRAVLERDTLGSPGLKPQQRGHPQRAAAAPTEATNVCVALLLRGSAGRRDRRHPWDLGGLGEGAPAPCEGAPGGAPGRGGGRGCPLSDVSGREPSATQASSTRMSTGSWTRSSTETRRRQVVRRVGLRRHLTDGCVSHRRRGPGTGSRHPGRGRWRHSGRRSVPQRGACSSVADRYVHQVDPRRGPRWCE